MAHTSEEVSTTDPSLDWGSSFVNPLTQLQLLQATTETRCADSLCQETERWNELTNRLQQRMIQDEEEIDGLLDRLADIKRNIKEMHASISHLRSRRDELRKAQNEILQNPDTSDETTFSDEFLSSKLTNISETVHQFERLFGIRLQRTTSDSLQLLFHGCSGSAAPDIVCSCTLRHNKAGRFQAVKCNPPVPDFERLVNHLNLTGDMRSFVILIRHRFCRYFELAAAVSSKVN
ncbi:hypothetical protein P879_05634 [Paragonimus westermani]|uniref:Kinetochore protein SPC25 n=1 Tax=Paragonimus westermani TaxID=34504 RepID=A0A8T0DLM7_9TREM|nr:hypothetical protein P879_05634 [Paragonimus westermani]